MYRVLRYADGRPLSETDGVNTAPEYAFPDNPLFRTHAFIKFFHFLENIHIIMYAEISNAVSVLFMIHRTDVGNKRLFAILQAPTFIYDTPNRC